MKELILPFKISLKIGKTTNRYPFGDVIISAKFKTNLAIGLCWLSFKIFFMGVKRLIG